MRTVLRVLLVIVTVVAILIGIGFALPREHTASSSIELPGAADTVWAVVRDLGALKDTWPDLTAVRRLPDRDGAEVWEETVSGEPLRLVVRRSDPPSILVTTIDADRDAPFGGTWTYQIDPIPAGVRVTVTEAGWVNNPLFRLVMRVIGPHTTMDGYLTALGRHFGHEVTPEHAP